MKQLWLLWPLSSCQIAKFKSHSILHFYIFMRWSKSIIFNWIHHCFCYLKLPVSPMKTLTRVIFLLYVYRYFDIIAVRWNFDDSYDKVSTTRILQLDLASWSTIWHLETSREPVLPSSTVPHLFLPNARPTTYLDPLVFRDTASNRSLRYIIMFQAYLSVCTILHYLSNFYQSATRSLSKPCLSSILS